MLLFSTHSLSASAAPCRNGAFNKTLGASIELAQSMIAAGENAGKPTSAFITSMDQPLGYAIGNWLEVKESVETLRGNGPADLTEISLTFAAQMLVQCGLASSWAEARAKADAALADGSALLKFEEMVKAQGGDVGCLRDLDAYPQAKLTLQACAAASGFVTQVDTLAIGLAACSLGAGREKVGDPVDFSAGILLHKKLGDAVHSGEALATLYTNKSHAQLSDAAQKVAAAMLIGPQSAVQPFKLISHFVTKSSVSAWEH